MMNKLNVLIVNDDGMDADGIVALTEWAKKLGNVTVCAPKNQQSGKSHGITIHDGIEIIRLDREIETWQVDSTPADCVRWGTIGLNRTYDLVLSGINRGYNLGDDIAYSGTCGAIFEAGFRGLKGIAISTDFITLSAAVEWLDRVWEYVRENKLFEKNSLYNVNIPPKALGIRMTQQGEAYYSDWFVKVGENVYTQDGYCAHENRHDLRYDTDATVDGWVTITPLTVKRDVR